MAKGSTIKGVLFVLVVALLTMVAGIIVLSYLAKAPDKAGLKTVKVYFTDEEGFSLTAEEHEIKKSSLEEEVREAVAEIIAGPNNKALARPLPDGTRLLGVRIKGSTAFVDMSKELIENYPGGTSAELQIIYSIVNTVALNFPEIKDVQLLIEGRKEEVISHIDIGSPLGPDTRMIKG